MANIELLFYNTNMNKSIRFRIYPNTAQTILIEKTLGCSRLIYNKGIDLRDSLYKEGISISYYQTCVMLTSLKREPEFEFLKEVDSIALQQSLKDLERSYKNFFAKRTGRPKFKTKHDHFQSYRTINQNDSIRLANGRIKLPKLGFVKIKQSMPVENIKNATIERVPSGKYYCVLNVDFEPELKFNKGGTIGIDVGINKFYTDSNGCSANNPGHLEKTLKSLKRQQRKLSRMCRGSKNHNKQRIKVAKLHERIANQRNDFLQKESTKLIRENQTICIENLNVRKMILNKRFARNISDASWSRFFAMLEYKASWYGCEVIKVPTIYPSSQTCSCCGYRNVKVRNLSVRSWICPACRTRHDRDHNAAINILNKGLSLKVS